MQNTVDLINAALKCECGGAMTPIESWDAASVLPKLPAFVPKLVVNVTGESVLHCSTCQRLHLHEEARAETLRVLLLSVGTAWRRLYPQDVAFVRAYLRMSEDEFESAIITLLTEPESVPRELGLKHIEEHHVYISDAVSNAVKVLALNAIDGLVSTLRSKWLTQPLIGGEHSLVTHASMRRKVGVLREKVHELAALIEKAHAVIRWVLLTRAHECAVTEFSAGEQVPGLAGESGCLIIEGACTEQHNPSKGTLTRVYALRSGGYAVVSKSAAGAQVSEKCELDVAADLVHRGTITWCMPLTQPPIEPPPAD